MQNLRAKLTEIIKREKRKIKDERRLSRRLSKWISLDLTRILRKKVMFIDEDWSNQLECGSLATTCHSTCGCRIFLAKTCHQPSKSSNQLLFGSDKLKSLDFVKYQI
nr:hypothetical protein CFP56_48916 [Quercus suber]